MFAVCYPAVVYVFVRHAEFDSCERIENPAVSFQFEFSAREFYCMVSGAHMILCVVKYDMAARKCLQNVSAG